MANKKTFIIAEMACSHDGSFAKAKKIIDAAFKSNADAIQLQIWKLEYMMDPRRSDFNTLKSIELSYNEWSKLISYTKNTYPKLKIYICFYEHQSIDFFKKLKFDGVKINTSDLTNPILLKKVSGLKKTINLSIGASSLKEIDYAINLIKKSNKNIEINLLYGIQNFPTNIIDLKVNIYNILTKKYSLKIGYQDHTSGGNKDLEWITALSIGNGVSVIEKHITTSRKSTKFDYESALNKNEFYKYVNFIRFLDSLNKNFKTSNFTASEKKYRKYQKKSIVLVKGLKKGEIIKMNNISFLRTSINGTSPHLYKKILNKKLLKNKKKYDLIYLSDVIKK